MSQIKVIYKNETKKFKKPADYQSLIQQTLKAFGSTLPKNFKFFYQDPEGDLISISCQEDLEEAYSSMGALRLIVEASIQEARNLMEPEFSMRSSSLNMPLQTSQSSINPNLIHGAMNQFQNTFDSIPSIPHSRPSDLKGGDDYGISQEFEDIGRYEEQKSNPHLHSIAVGGQSPF